jgi:hypothetical protein
MRREPDVSRRGITRCHSIAGRHGVTSRHGVTGRRSIANRYGIARGHSVAQRQSSVTRTYSVAGCATRVVRSDAGRVGSTAAGATDGVRQPKRRRESGPRIRRHRDAGNRGDRLASSDGRRANGGGHRGEFRCASVLGRWRGGKRSRTGCRRAYAEPGGAYAAGQRRASDGADVGIHARWRRRDAGGDAFSQ